MTKAYSVVRRGNKNSETSVYALILEEILEIIGLGHSIV